MNYTATYSPEDNKLRLYASGRLAPEEYSKVKSEGFIWAPKQQLFVAPAWTPSREDFLIEMCGEIDDEDTSLVDRAEERADRFVDYSQARASDATSAQKVVERITDGIPLGQPILVGHHSEKHARKDAERIENGMRKAVKMWEQAQYWKARAAGAIRAAKYKERPDVRARRIKGLEADKRKRERDKSDAEKFLKVWRKEGLTVPEAKAVANYDHITCKFPLSQYPREAPISQYEGDMGLWSALDHGIINAEQASALAIPAHERSIAYAVRWINHLENRLTYEREMLQEAGGTAADKFYIEVGGKVLVRGEWVVVLRVNKTGGVVNSLSTNRKYVSKVGIEEVKDYKPPEAEVAEKVKAAMKLPPLCNYPGEGFKKITQAEWDKRVSDYKGTTVLKGTETNGAHRVRYMITGGYNKGFIYITDAKRKDAPPPNQTETPKIPGPERVIPPPPVYTCGVCGTKSNSLVHCVSQDSLTKEAVVAMKETLKNGVKVVVAPQLFPTPAEIVQQMIYRADLHKYPALRILEPSAGTGAILDGLQPWIGTAEVVAVEINLALADVLRDRFREGVAIQCADFLNFNGDLGIFDRIIMNPPFENGMDIKHIQHALNMLKPGGRLVALCANGPRQQEAFKEASEYWEDLPEGSFKEQGTGVNTALMVLTKTEPKEAEKESDTMTKANMTKKDVKEAVKALKAKTKGSWIAPANSELICAICGKEIRQGHFYKILSADATHTEKRYYHEKTCGPGSEPWKKFKENGKTAPKGVVGTAPKRKDREVLEGAMGLNKKAKPAKSREINEFGHPVGTQADKIDKLLLEGTNRAKVEAAKIIWPWFGRHVNHLKAVHKIEVSEKDGFLKAPKPKGKCQACLRW